jgi:hypothetical protein
MNREASKNLTRITRIKGTDYTERGGEIVRPAFRQDWEQGDLCHRKQSLNLNPRTVMTGHDARPACVNVLVASYEGPRTVQPRSV